MTSTNPQPKPNDTDPRWSDFDAFLTAEDLDGKAQTWRITKASITEVYDQKEKKVVFKPVIHFAATPKYMILSPTNRHRLQEAFGNRCANAVGKLVTVKTEKVKAFGKERDVLRITIPQQVDTKTGEIAGNGTASASNDQTRWTDFCKEKGFGAAEIEAALKTRSVAGWMKEHSKTIDDAMNALVTWAMDHKAPATTGK